MAGNQANENSFQNWDRLTPYAVMTRRLTRGIYRTKDESTDKTGERLIFGSVSYIRPSREFTPPLKHPVSDPRRHNFASRAIEQTPKAVATPRV